MPKNFLACFECPGLGRNQNAVYVLFSHIILRIFALNFRYIYLLFSELGEWAVNELRVEEHLFVKTLVAAEVAPDIGNFMLLSVLLACNIVS